MDMCYIVIMSDILVNMTIRQVNNKDLDDTIIQEIMKVIMMKV